MNVVHKYPTSPGVYLHKNNRGEIIYIGKAKNVRKRIANYRPRKDHDPKTRLLIKNIVETEVIVTHNELEALLLENRLIKKHKPKYNIALKESRRYYYIRVTNEDFPQILLARQTNKKDRFFGPYTHSPMQITKIVQELFRIRRCKNTKGKTCFYYDLGLCAGSCGGKITKEDYETLVKQAIRLITHGSDELNDEYTHAMEVASEKQEYEKALIYRQRINLLDRLKQRQVVDIRGRHDQDVIGIATVGEKSCVTLIKVKKGVITKKQDFVFLASDDLLNEFIKAYYATRPTPNELIVEGEFDATIPHYLGTIWERNVSITKPVRGIKYELLTLAKKNAYTHFNLEDPVLIEIKETLELDKLPMIIDCFDISNFGESVISGACVQFKNKVANKSAYRLYNIKGDFGQDDFRSMHEVIKRRYKVMDLPDLLLIDGGHIQVSFARRALAELGLSCAVRGLAKREETIIFPLGKEVVLSRRQEGAKLLLKIRDSVHNFVIRQSRNRFKHLYKQSELDGIPGIGDATKFALLTGFEGSVINIKKASKKELVSLLGQARGTKVYNHFHEL